MLTLSFAVIDVMDAFYPGICDTTSIVREYRITSTDLAWLMLRVATKPNRNKYILSMVLQWEN